MFKLFLKQSCKNVIERFNLNLNFSLKGDTLVFKVRP